MSGELKVENLRYKHILKDINFSLAQGTINVLMGNSGSGKTLLFKCIFCLIKYDGLISVNGIIVKKENINDVRQNFGLYLGIDNLENKNVFLNLIEPLNNLNYTEDIAKKKVYDISKKLGIENILYKEVESLSHSQKKVVSFAQSIIHEPKFILIDGLFDSLDVYYKNKVFSYLKQMKKNKKNIILFTTNSSEDLLFVDNLIIIKNGKIIINDDVKNLMENESLFLKNDIKLPFLVDLSYKLKAYDLIDKLIYDDNEMVNEIWQ